MYYSIHMYICNGFRNKLPIKATSTPPLLRPVSSTKIHLSLSSALVLPFLAIPWFCTSSEFLPPSHHRQPIQTLILLYSNHRSGTTWKTCPYAKTYKNTPSAIATTKRIDDYVQKSLQFVHCHQITTQLRPLLQSPLELFFPSIDRSHELRKNWSFFYLLPDFSPFILVVLLRGLIVCVRVLLFHGSNYIDINIDYLIMYWFPIHLYSVCYYFWFNCKRCTNVTGLSSPSPPSHSVLFL